MEVYFTLSKILKGSFVISGLFFSKRDIRAQALSICGPTIPLAVTSKVTGEGESSAPTEAFLGQDWN